MDVYAAIHGRRDMLGFTDERPPRDVLERVIEAATWAPNHHLTEPWRFHVVAGERREAMTDAIASWLSSNGGTEGAERSMRSKIMRAPVSIFVSQAGIGEDAEREREDYAACAAAVQNLLLAAHAEGLVGHLSTDRLMTYEGTRRYLALSADVRVVAIVNLGYLPAGVVPKEGHRQAPTVRWDWV